MNTKPIQRKRRGNSRFFILFFLITIVLLSLSYGLVQIMKRMPIFNISKIEVTGYRFLDEKFLSDIVKDQMGHNLMAISKKDLLKRYSAIKRIQKIKITRVLPSKLKISIVERRSIVYVKTLEGNLYPIDEEKTVLDNHPTSVLEDMPIADTAYQNAQMVVGRKLTSKYLENVIWFQKAILGLNPDFEKCISEYYTKDGLLYFVETSTGAKIILGNQDIPSRIRRFMFLKENGSFEKNSIFDFRFQDQVVVKKEVS